MGSPKPLMVRTPEERFNNLEKLGYNFKENYLSIDAGCGVTLPRVHYIDEGPRDGHVVLCLHGEPSWSFLYRKMVPVLVAAGYRVIVPDFIGFGKSDKYTNPENYTHELHTMMIRKLLDHLDVSKIILVCQDWGGLTGLSVVKDVPDKFSHLVIMNTGLPSGETLSMGDLPKIQKLLPFVLWRSCVTLFGIHLPVGKLMGSFFLKVKDPAISAAYNAPYPSSLYKGGCARWPLLVPLFKDEPVASHMRAAQDCLKQWKKPALVMFSDRDPVTRGQDKAFLGWLPHAKTETVKGAGHFLQETHGELLANNLIKFVKEAN